jgi:hypothetical protein
MVGCGEETRFLGVDEGCWWGLRNRVSVVGIRGYLWNAKKKPGFWGLMVGVEKPGFCCGYQGLSVECDKETRFLGLTHPLSTTILK